MFGLIADEPLHPSGTSVADLDIVAFDNDRNFTHSIGKSQHLFKPFHVLLDIEIICPAFVRRPGVCGVGSARFAVNDDPVRHGGHTS